MKHVIAASISLTLILTLSVTFGLPKVMAVDLEGGENGVYTSEVFHLPIRICNASLDISVLIDTFLRATLELRTGNSYVRFNLHDLSISGHCEYNILELFAKITSTDITLKLYVDTDGIVQGNPRVSIVYYGLF
jgi:hypothetical protein